ncbi:4a-hydroxytetrahydrobiopterin dehydratase family protein [Paenibacillus athensensis]|nr:hypothetical protein [Paenibacillus athensensis]
MEEVCSEERVAERLAELPGWEREPEQRQVDRARLSVSRIYERDRLR